MRQYPIGAGACYALAADWSQSGGTAGRVNKDLAVYWAIVAVGEIGEVEVRISEIEAKLRLKGLA